MCANIAFPGQKRVQCRPHTDHKNIVGVCAVVVYQNPGDFHFFYRWLTKTNSLIGANFNHSQRSWLVLWEAGIVIELPPWVVAIFPSSLFYHFNIDITGKLVRFYCYESLTKVSLDKTLSPLKVRRGLPPLTPNPSKKVTTKEEVALSILMRRPCTNCWKPIQPPLRRLRREVIPGGRIMEKMWGEVFKKTWSVID